jgi:hypothetical protein
VWKRDTLGTPIKKNGVSKQVLKSEQDNRTSSVSNALRAKNTLLFIHQRRRFDRGFT